MLERKILKVHNISYTLRTFRNDNLT